MTLGPLLQGNKFRNFPHHIDDPLLVIDPGVGRQRQVGHQQAGKIARAALDVTEPEPIPPDSPLLELDNIIIAPHIASASRATRDKMAQMAADNLLAGVTERDVGADLFLPPEYRQDLCVEDGEHRQQHQDDQRVQVAQLAKSPLVEGAVTVQEEGQNRNDDDEAGELDEAFDPLLAEERGVSLMDLVEDELILALPVVPLHEDCEGPQHDDATVVASESSDNPFAALEALKKSD